MKSNRILVSVLAAIILVVAIVAVVVSNTTQKTYDVNSPEGAVQHFLEAIYAGDNLKASAYISSTSPCTADDLDLLGVQEKPRIYFTESTISGTNAQVKIDVELNAGSPLQNTTTESHTLRLVRFGTGWQITGIPWPLYDCGVMK